MKPKVKICGIRYPHEVLFLNRLPVDYVGFVFAESKRKVTPEGAIELMRNLRSDILRVGVFSDIKLNQVQEIIKECSLDIAQLHGPYEREAILSIGIPVWKGISMKGPDCSQQLEEYPCAKAFVLDTFCPGLMGGTGKTFSWEWAHGLSKHHIIVLAGGLNKENVKSAIALVKPHVVDVSSGVEGLNGKDETMVERFIKAVKNV